MSQVQIRQMPIEAHEMAGSWFSSGYYGHFRGKSRADLCNEFRQLARPNPPKKFLYRHNSEASLHPFSQHDNRFKFENDPLVRCTQAGFGKRRSQVGGGRGEFDPFFIGWIPENVDRKKFIDNIKPTSYAVDYSRQSTSSQILSDIQSNNSLPQSEISMYSSIYNHGQPNQQLAKQIRQETFQRYSTTQMRRSQLQKNDRSFNVASCLVWNNTENENTKINDKSKNILPSIPNKSKEKPYSHATTSGERDCNFTLGSSPRIPSSLEQTQTNSMECLFSKYM